MRVQMFVCVVLVGCMVGCGGPSTGGGTPSGTPGGAAGTGETATPASDAAEESAGIAIGLGQPVSEQPASEETSVQPAPADEPAMPVEPAAPAEPDTERVEAKAGVGAKGRSLDEHEGVYVTPAKTLFTVREKVIFEIEVPNALKLYEATNGNPPRTHEEFMSQVIEANGVRLPELPAGQRYVWDPETKELMVERPVR